MSPSYQRYFDESYADFWKEQTRRYGHDEGHQRLIDLVSSLVPEGGLLLECGMGNGFPFTRAWSARHRLAGCDLSVRALTMARPDLGGGASARLAGADLRALPFRTGAGQAVVCARALNYVPQTWQALDELWRVTAPGGHLVFDAFNRDHPPRRRAALRAALRRPWRTLFPAPGQQHALRISGILDGLRARGASLSLFDDQGFPLPAQASAPWRDQPTLWIVAGKPR